MTEQTVARAQATAISLNRDLAGKPHTWIVTGAESAECRLDSQDISLSLYRSAARHWTLSGETVGKLVVKADSLAAAIGQIEYRRFAVHSERAVRAAEIAKALAKATEPQIAGNGIVLMPSQSDPNRQYRVDVVRKTCACPDFQYRRQPCKHLLAATNSID